MPPIMQQAKHIDGYCSFLSFQYLALRLKARSISRSPSDKMITNLCLPEIIRATFGYLDRLNARQIRLLDLKYGHGEGILQFDLQTYSLSNRPNYIALSYTWGDPNETVPVLCDGKTINITRNLNEALWQLRENWKSFARKSSSKNRFAQPQYFWIDAVCINQSNQEEKSCQVGVMGEIYRQAHNVIVWLGPSDDSSDSTVDYLNRFGAKAEDCHMEMGHEPFMTIWQEWAAATSAKEIPTNPYIFHKDVDGKVIKISRRSLQKLLNSISGWHSQDDLLPVAGIKKFFTRSWWGRIWVLQEVTLPKNVEFVCGTKTITRIRCSAVINAYLALCQVLRARSKSGGQSLTQYQLDITMSSFYHRPNVMLSSRRLYQRERFPLAALLRATCVGSINLRRHGPHHLDATNERDKIFALLGLASDQEELKRAGIFPDYTKSYEQIYAMTMVALIQQGHVSLLSMCQTPRSSQLPSWVPDWSRPITDMLQDLENDHVTLDPKFNASGAKPKDAKITIIRKEDAIEGIAIACQLYDEVYRVGVFPDRVDSHEVPISEEYSWPIQWLLEIIRLTYWRKPRHSSFAGRLRAAARTSIGNVGFGQDGQLARLGEDRFSDAVILLKLGVMQINNKRFAKEAREFLASEIAQNIIRDNAQKQIRDNAKYCVRLSSEIVGKSLGRLPFLTKTGHLALSSEHVERGDVVALIKGAQVPFVLRRQSDGRYGLISEAYVDGIMDGEAADPSKFGPVGIV